MNENQTEAPRPTQFLEIIRTTPPANIGDLDLVKNKFVQNYNQTHPGNKGDLMYHRQLINLKQLMAANDQLRAVDPFSIYACFVTAAAKGYSLDPADNEVYMVPKKGKAVLWRQAGAHVRRLMETNQIRYADQAKIVYQGDVFQVENGRVIKHVENYASETYMAGYVRFQLDDSGNDRYFIYRRSDWEGWKKKASEKSVDTWQGGALGQPEPGFLRTKLVKHACMEKVWASGTTPPVTEIFTDVEYEDLPEEQNQQPQQPSPILNGHQAKPPAPQQASPVKPVISDEEAFQHVDVHAPAGVVHDDDEF